MKMSMRLEICSPYTKQELYDLWFNFRNDPNAAATLSDFMQSDKAAAETLIDEFESRLRYDHRFEREGKDY